MVRFARRHFTIVALGGAFYHTRPVARFARRHLMIVAPGGVFYHTRHTRRNATLTCERWRKVRLIYACKGENTRPWHAQTHMLCTPNQTHITTAVVFARLLSTRRGRRQAEKVCTDVCMGHRVLWTVEHQIACSACGKMRPDLGGD